MDVPCDQKVCSMAYDPGIHHRRSIRLKGYDYSKAGMYFITICCQDRARMFGEVIHGKMVLNAAGSMIDAWWQKIPEKFPNIALGAYQIMPDHFHAIVIITTPSARTGADPCVCPPPSQPNHNDQPMHQNHPGESVRENPVGEPIHQKHPDESIHTNQNGLNINCNLDIDGWIDDGNTVEIAVGNPGGHMESCKRDSGEHKGSPLYRIVQWFKTMSTNEYIRGVKSLGWKPFNGKLWQRNYYDQIIWDEHAFHRITKYIIDNPAKWKKK